MSERSRRLPAAVQRGAEACGSRGGGLAVSGGGGGAEVLQRHYLDAATFY